MARLLMTHFDDGDGLLYVCYIVCNPNGIQLVIPEFALVMVLSTITCHTTRKFENSFQSRP